MDLGVSMRAQGYSLINCGRTGMQPQLQSRVPLSRLPELCALSLDLDVWPPQKQL